MSQGARSPFDDDTDYWSTRNSILSGVRTEKIYKLQKGLCPLCQRKLNWFESWERHRKNGDKFDNRLSNIQVVHLRCHRKELYRIK
jgi:RNA-directed DNA polymerase